MFDEPSRLNDLVKRYRQFALSARLSASTADGLARDQFTTIAEHWEQLAIVAERRIEDKAAEPNGAKQA